MTKHRFIIAAILAGAMVAFPASFAGAATTTSSTNYAGYRTNISSTSAASIVQMTWKVPQVRCPRTGDSRVTIWPGLLASDEANLYQTGTESVCHNGVASYYAWYEHFPSNEIPYSSAELPVKPGDVMHAMVSASRLRDELGNQPFDLYLINQTTGVSQYRQFLSPLGSIVGECEIEAPNVKDTNSPLANFGQVVVTDCEVQQSHEPTSHPWAYLAKPDSAMDSANSVYGMSVTRDTMVTAGKKNQSRASTSAPTADGHFVVTWHHY